MRSWTNKFQDYTIACYNPREYLLHNDAGVHRNVVAMETGFTPIVLAKGNWREPVIRSTNDRQF